MHKFTNCLPSPLTVGLLNFYPLGSDFTSIEISELEKVSTILGQDMINDADSEDGSAAQEHFLHSCTCPISALVLAFCLEEDGRRRTGISGQFTAW